MNLEELILACGDDFGWLKKDDNNWSVYKRLENYQYGLWTIGDTPLEAMQNFYNKCLPL